MFYIPILGGLALALGNILEKIMLAKKEISFKRYQTLEFLGIIIVMIFFVWFFWKVEEQAFLTKNIIIFGSVVIFAIAANLFTFYSMKWEKLTKLEPAKLLEPLFVVILAIIFSFFVDGVYDRNIKVIIPTLIATFALIFSHIEKRHLEFNKYFIAAIFGSFFFAIELVTSRLILDYYSPITFYFLRCVGVFLFSVFIFKPKIKDLDNKTRWQLLLIGGIWVAFRVIIYYGYLTLGIIFTTLIVMTGPILIYVFARIFLKEKLTSRNIIASVIIIICIVYTIWI